MTWQVLQQVLKQQTNMTCIEIFGISSSGRQYIFPVERYRLYLTFALLKIFLRGFQDPDRDFSCDNGVYLRFTFLARIFNPNFLQIGHSHRLFINSPT